MNSLQYRERLKEVDLEASKTLSALERAARLSELLNEMLCRECIGQRQVVVGDDSFGGKGA